MSGRHTSGIVQQKWWHREHMREEVVHHCNISPWELDWLRQLRATQDDWITSSRRVYRHPFFLTADRKLREAVERFAIRESLYQWTEPTVSQSQTLHLENFCFCLYFHIWVIHYFINDNRKWSGNIKHLYTFNIAKTINALHNWYIYSVNNYPRSPDLR